MDWGLNLYLLSKVGHAVHINKKAIKLLSDIITDQQFMWLRYITLVNKRSEWTKFFNLNFQV